MVQLFGTARSSDIADISSSQATDSSAPPANAPAANKGTTKDVFTGLCEALNAYQVKLSSGTKPEQRYPDIYEIEFAKGIESAVLKKPGTPNYSQTPNTNPTSAKAVKDPTTNSVGVTSRSIQVSAGTQIIQLIDEVMRGSSYITEQQLYIVDEKTQQVKPNPNPPKQVSWYKISVQATQLQYDDIRRDHAYRLKYVVTPYAISSMQSDWFPKNRYRGSHKVYNHWFTGQNTSILNFEQEFNQLYRLTMSNPKGLVDQQGTGYRDQPRRINLPTSENHAKGAPGYTNEAADNAADFLYNPADFSKAKVRIIGDPAWMQQGEVATGVSAKTFNFGAFDSSGGINFDSQEVVFSVNFNRPADYNYNTGLVDVTGPGLASGQPQESSVYVAIRCKNSFRQGKFEQEIEGKLLVGQGSNRNTTLVSNRSTATDAGNTRTSGTDTTSQTDWQAEVNRTQGNEWNAEVLRTSGNDWQTDSGVELYEDQNAEALPLAEEPPTSDGDIEPIYTYNDVQVAEIDASELQYGDREA
jgi:hypothetical protein